MICDVCVSVCMTPCVVFLSYYAGMHAGSSWDFPDFTNVLINKLVAGQVGDTAQLFSNSLTLYTHLCYLLYL